jgi:serine/threonine-protein kinase
MGGETQFGRDYLLHEEIGSGSWAVVYRATSRSGGRPFAAKVLRPELSADRRVRDLFLREELALRDLHHRSIVSVHDFIVESGRMALFMEYVDGPDLRTHLGSRGGTLPAADVTAIGAQLAGALAYAHAHGVVHLDVKPENVLVGHDDEVKLGDFGVAAILLEAETPVGGTDAYAAPELAAGGPPTCAADVYSLGVLLAELATGTRPAGHTAPSGMPPALGEVVGDCLNTDARNRPSARSVAARLRLPDAAPGVSPDPLRTRLRRPGAVPPSAPVPQKPRNRRRTAAIVSGAAALATAIVGLTVNASAGEHPRARPTMTLATTAPTTYDAEPTPIATEPVATEPVATEPVATEAVPAQIPARITYTAHLADDAGTLYIAVREDVAIAYFCDGKRIEAWFAGTAEAGELHLTSKKGGGTITATYDADAARGSVKIGGKTTRFTLPPADGQAGLFRSLTKINGARVKGSWIVLPNGDQVGVVTIDEVPEPAPALDLTTNTATVEGVAVDTTRVDVETGEGFN